MVFATSGAAHIRSVKEIIPLYPVYKSIRGRLSRSGARTDTEEIRRGRSSRRKNRKDYRRGDVEKRY